MNFMYSLLQRNCSLEYHHVVYIGSRARDALRGIFLRKYARADDDILKGLFPGVLSRGLHWENKTYKRKRYRVFSSDVTAAMLVSINKGTAAMLRSQTNPPGIALYSYANVFFCFG